MISRHLLWTLASVAISISSSAHAASPVDQGDPKLLGKIVSSLLERQVRFQSVRLVASGETLIPQETITFPDYDTLYPPKDHAFQRKLDILIDVANRRCRRNEVTDVFHTDERKFNTEICHYLYDGRNFQEFFPRNEYARLGVERGPYATDLRLRGDARGMFIHAIDLPLLFFLGMIPARDFEIQSPSIAFPFERATCKSLGDSFDRKEALIEIVDSKVQPKSRVVYRIDLGRMEVVSRSRYHRDRESSRMSVEYAEYGGVRFPSQWRLKLFSTVNGKEVLTDDTRLTTESVEFDPQVDDDYFGIDPAPGMNVRDLVADRRFRVPEPGQATRSIEEIYWDEKTAVSPVRYFFIALTVPTILLLALWLHLRGGSSSR